ncbi:MAG: cytochrome C oxidase subunit IV family protein [Haliscomenobacter sp.]|uniref:cytochrome C oxidase subunit IV family protein n=1 Tax=Haliscomenobacter sp. TaxID=2717303 RepID=UPI0029AA8D39|nr:cytochrome C oxidase subunit IV family protein [Haliscomenobacter sp.]MDX2071507.1 cytochrome C oxidase subunit IV family protein [Haliscomenobacter sp.]
MSHLSYEESKKRVRYGLVLLAVVTLIEVAISLFGKGHIISGVHGNVIVLATCGLLIAGLSLYKAYFIVYEFMHMKYEVKGLAMSVLLPTLLLIWAIIAFFQEGNAWKNRREDVQKRNSQPITPAQEGSLLSPDTYQMDWKG